MCLGLWKPSGLVSHLALLQRRVAGLQKQAQELAGALHPAIEPAACRAAAITAGGVQCGP